MSEQKSEINWEDAAKFGWDSGPDPKTLKICRIVEALCNFSMLHAEIEVLVERRFFRLKVTWDQCSYSIDLLETPIRRVAEGRTEVFNILDFDRLYARVQDWTEGYSAGYSAACASRKKQKQRKRGRDKHG